MTLKHIMTKRIPQELYGEDLATTTIEEKQVDTLLLKESN